MLLCFCAFVAVRSAFGMYQVNGQTVLEEDYDENYQPTEEGLFCVMLYVVPYLSRLNYGLNRQGVGDSTLPAVPVVQPRL